MAYQPNIGERPAECTIWDEAGKKVVGYRDVHVILFCGWDSKRLGHAPWPSGGKMPATDWTVSRKPHRFQIKEWELA